MSVRHVPRFFNIEAKKFRIKVDEWSYGGSLLITEMVRNRFFHISLQLRCVAWLIKEMQVLSFSKEQAVFRMYRGDSYQVWLERSYNSRGTHMRLTKCVHGVVKSVIVPQGPHNEGWILLKENLEAILTGKEKRSFVTGARGGSRVSCSASNKTYKEAVETRPVAEALEKKSVLPDDTSNWSWVVVCERQVVHQSWNDIRAALRVVLKKDVTLFPYQVNRAFFTCDSKLEALKVSRIGRVAVEKQTDVWLFSWEQGSKNNTHKIVSYGGWIGISGLPMHWWSKKFFERIGEECGGLIEVGHRTENFKYLFEAKIKLRSNSTGFLPEILRISEGTETFHVKIRPISSAVRPTESDKALPNEKDVHNSTKRADRNLQSDSGGETPASSNPPADGIPPHVAPSRDKVNASQNVEDNEPEHRSTEVTSLIFGSVQGQNVLRDRSHIPRHSLGSNTGGPSKIPSAQTKSPPTNLFEPNTSVLSKAHSEPAFRNGRDKDTLFHRQSISGYTSTKTKQQLKFLSKFGRENREGARGSRTDLPHIDARLYNTEGPMKADFLSSMAEEVIGDISDASSMCPNSVESAATLPSSDSEFTDDASSIEFKLKPDAFLGEEGLFEALFADPVDSRAIGDEPTKGQAYKADEEDEPATATDPKILRYNRKRRKRREKGRQDLQHKVLLSKMGISLKPLKKNLTNRRRDKDGLGNSNKEGKETYLRDHNSH